jgi:hypothetical protein
VIARRAALGLAFAPAVARAQEGVLARFRVMREGREVGTHVVTREGAEATRSRVEILVRLAGFTVFRSTVESRETIAGGRLAAFDNTTDRNGRATRLVVRPAGARLRAEGPEGSFDLPREALPLAWWVPSRFTGAPLFEPGTGRLLAAPRRTPRAGGGYAITVPGQEPPAEGFYDAAGTWVGFTTRGTDGSLVTYERA